MSIDRIDHVEFHVANADEAARELAGTFGFRYGPHPGAALLPAGRTGVLLRQGDIRLLFTSSDEPADRAAQFVHRHGDGVAAVALSCEDAAACYATALAAGAVPISPPAVHQEDGRRVVSASIRGFGDVDLRFVQREPAPADEQPDGLLAEVDHLAVCVPSGELASTVRFMEQTLGLRQIFTEYIAVGTQGMDSIVVQSPSGGVTLTLIEPDTSRDPGQIDGFLEQHQGVGVQHLAFRTESIALAVQTLQDRGVAFLSTPERYYDQLRDRLGDSVIPLETLRRLNILVDRDHGGQLFQIFTRSVHPRRTFFLEVIERRGALTFGSANIKALYEAVERTDASHA
ncbi:4-hydroxymandelate synthase [Kitasatospora sp. MAA4]|uniref:4-hydroxyphenylpyruvate dioxygenase n=1 Tax=Kitasatospora sp. MAA4 TaxID=3035093 RepID=UPI0024757D6D|nr:4-hydroxyphenylpyruvate dioxygenase [Kitasatospora sp. MAA4]MDH6131414.1 4-hydroxymandelate synthase [Kitasatospora sp. MAA4]